MHRFNLSAWAVSHPALILFLILALGVGGFFSYEKLGRAEDPSFTVKVVNVTAIWPGATAKEMQEQVADPIEKKMQELPYFDKVQTSSPRCRSPSRTMRRRRTCHTCSICCARNLPTCRAACPPIWSGRRSTTNSATSTPFST
jgi:hypothetical protein